MFEVIGNTAYFGEEDEQLLLLTSPANVVAVRQQITAQLASYRAHSREVSRHAALTNDEQQYNFDLAYRADAQRKIARLLELQGIIDRPEQTGNDT